MSIWQYNDASRDINSEHLTIPNCIFCGNSLKLMHSRDGDGTLDWGGYAGSYDFCICPCCGWWRVIKEEEHLMADSDRGDRLLTISKGAIGSLSELNLDDIETPLNEVKFFLVARYEKRFAVNPQLFEETVASVFGGLGYDSIATAYTCDGGIDIILRKENDRTIGVQVKRWANKIKVEQIRALAGALVLGGHTKGIFVTTSDFQSGAKIAAEKFARLGYPIELMDAKTFYDALQISQINNWNDTQFENYERYLKSLHLKTIKETSEFVDWD